MKVPSHGHYFDAIIIMLVMMMVIAVVVMVRVVMVMVLVMMMVMMMVMQMIMTTMRMSDEKIKQYTWVLKGSRIKLLHNTNLYLEVYATK